MAETAAPGTTRYLCPLRCGWHHDVPPPSVAEFADLPTPPGVMSIEDAMGHLVAGASLRTAAATESALVAHLETHSLVEFVSALEGLHAQIRRLTAPIEEPTP